MTITATDSSTVGGTVGLKRSGAASTGYTGTATLGSGDGTAGRAGRDRDRADHRPLAGGTSVTITGVNLADAGAVTFGSTAAASFTVDGATAITAVSPAGTGTVDVTVTAPGGTSPTGDAARFTYVDPPVVSSLTPADGPTAGGRVVVIAGSGFTDASAVRFGFTPAASFTVDSAERITAVSPAGSAGSVHVRVTTPVGISAATTADKFVFADPARDPKIAAVFETPTLSAGVSTTLTYSLFNPNTRASFGGLEARFTLPDGLVGSTIASACADAFSISGQVITVNFARIGPRARCDLVVTVTATVEGKYDAGKVTVKSEKGETTPEVDLKTKLTVVDTVAAVRQIERTQLTVGQTPPAFTPVTATGGKAPITFAVTPELPAGLAYDTATGAVSGSATEARALGRYRVTVTDAQGKSDAAAFALGVAPAPTIADPGVVEAIVGRSETIDLAVTGGVKPYTCTVESSSDPAVIARPTSPSPPAASTATSRSPPSPGRRATPTSRSAWTKATASRPARRSGSP